MPATTIVTSAQFLAMPEEYDQHGNRIKDELIAGEIVRVPPLFTVKPPLPFRVPPVQKNCCVK